MAAQEGVDGIREAVAVFDDAESLERAIDELQSSGFDRAELSLLAGEHAVEAKLGHAYDKVEQLEDAPDAARAVYVSKEAIGDAEGALVGGLVYVGSMATAGAVVATGGALATVIAAAAAAGAAGGMIGGMLARWLDRHHADYLHQQLEKGGLLLWVRTRDPEHERRAVEVLQANSAHDVHVHELPAT